MVNPAGLRPLAVIMVADPTPMTLALIANLSHWCDIVLTEGTTITSGQPRRPLRDEWFETTGLSRPTLRVITTGLGGANTWQRQRVQRDSVLPLLLGEPKDRIVLMVDSDEFLDQAPTLEMLAELENPIRLRMVPHYGAIDRVARSIHCCESGAPESLRDPNFKPKKRYRVAGPAAATVEQILAKSPSQIRFGSPVRKGSPTVGSHLTLTESADQVTWKLANMRHRWHPRILQRQHVNTMMTAGIHHAGWWITEYRKPEPELVELATAAGLRECGPPAPEQYLRALRTWAEIRLNPELPDGFVAMIDDYVSQRPTDVTDFLSGMEAGILERGIGHRGYAEDDLTGGAKREDVDQAVSCGAVDNDADASEDLDSCLATRECSVFDQSERP